MLIGAVDLLEESAVSTLAKFDGANGVLTKRRKRSVDIFQTQSNIRNLQRRAKVDALAVLREDGLAVTEVVGVLVDDGLQGRKQLVTNITGTKRRDGNVTRAPGPAPLAATKVRRERGASN